MRDKKQRDGIAIRRLGQQPAAPSVDKGHRPYCQGRLGFHDSEDTLANIDLENGVLLATNSIEKVARTVTEKPPRG
jgi:hypothetical protein